MLSSTYLLFRFQSQHFLLHYRHEKSFIFYWNSFLLSSSVFFKCCWYTGKSPCSDLSGPYGLVKWMEKFETESIFFGRPFDDSARVQQNCANPVAALKNQYYTLGYIHFQNDSINSYLYEHCGLSMNIMDYLWTLWIIMMIDINLKRFLTIVKVWILELSLKKKIHRYIKNIYDMWLYFLYNRKLFISPNYYLKTQWENVEPSDIL